MVDAKAVEHGGVQIADVDRITDDIVAVVIGLAVVDTRFEPPPATTVVKQRPW